MPVITRSPFAGTWRIVWMSGWDQDYVDLDVPGHFTFGVGRSGTFQFGMVQSQLDCRITKTPASRIDFTWHGFDEGDEVTGRGHAEVVNGELQGHLYFHLGDDSAFRAVKKQAARANPSRKRKSS